MKKDKKQYSMTAKQRKTQRDTADTQKAPQEGEALILGVKRKNFFIALIAVITAVILFVGAILITIWLQPYRNVDRTVAVIQLSNNMQLEFEIFEEEVPYAATNFIYLARKGYFDNTVIFDMQNDFTRFGGFTDTSGAHRATDKEFAAKITDITPPDNHSTGRLFTYRLKEDQGNDAKYGRTAGYLSFMQADFATEFQICSKDEARLTAGNGSTDPRTFNAVSFGRYLDGNLEKIQQLYASVYPAGAPARVEAKNTYFYVPSPVIKIESVKIYNLDMAKWRNFNFDNFLNGPDEATSGALWQWTNT